MKETKIKRILELYEAANASYEKGDFRDAYTKYRLVLSEAEGLYNTLAETRYSFEHPLDVVLFRYFEGKEEEILEAELPMSRFYRKLGITQIRLKDFEGALLSFKQSSRWNPADADMKLRVAELQRRFGRADMARTCALEAYHYCFTRAEMARYYRILGNYYLETYKPDLSACLYHYSQVFYPSKTAEKELEFLYQAMKKERTEVDPSVLVESLTEAGIPLGPDDTTIGLIYQFGMQYYNSGQYDMARQCLSLVYDITADEETGMILARLQDFGTDSVTTFTEGAAD